MLSSSHFALDAKLLQLIHYGGGLVIVRRDGAIVVLTKGAAILREGGYTSPQQFCLHLMSDHLCYLQQALRTAERILAAGQDVCGRDVGLGKFIDATTVHRMALGDTSLYACGVIVPTEFLVA